MDVAEIAPFSRMDLHDYVGIIHYLQELLDVGAGVADRGSLRDYVRSSAARHVIYAFYRESLLTMSA